MTAFIILGFAGACHLLMALLLTWNRWRTPRLAAAPAPPAPPPEVLIVVPARNEEQNIAACVSALLAQDYPRFRVRVVDDHSTDRTAAIVRDLAAADPRLELRHAPDLPPGWLGKPHALHAGTRDAAADYLLFVDADLRLAPSALSRSVGAAAASGAALLTVVPALVTQGFWERAVQPVVGALIFSLIDPVKVADPRSAVASANGPYLMFSRAGYERIGGHAAVAGEIVEDLRLAEAVKRAGLPLCYLHGTELLRLRMYDSLRAILQGWGKNAHVMLGRAPFLAPICALLLCWVFLLPALSCFTLLCWTVLSGLGQAAAPPPIWPLVVGAYAADWLGRLSLHRNYGVSLRGARSLGGVVVAWILCLSAYRAAFGKSVSWRGRAYPAAQAGSQR